MTPEAKTKMRVRRMLETEQVYHFMPPGSGYGRAGIPDIIGCVNGFFLAIECKADRGALTALQERELTRARGAGGQALVVYNTEEDLQRLRSVIWLLKMRTWT